MHYSIIGILSALALFTLMILLIALGHHFGKQRAATGGLNITEGAVFTLMALLVAFTFSSASQRFDQRRIMIIEEANAIGTAYLRLDMLKPDEQSALRKDFMMYINSRLAVYKLIPDFNAVHEELKRAEQIKAKLWRDAVAACANSNSPSTAMLILPAINAMFDIASARVAITSLHPHYFIFCLLFLVALLSAFLTGYSITGKTTWRSIHVFSYAVIMTLTIYIIVDLEVPRLGFIKETGFDTLISDVRDSMST